MKPREQIHDPQADIQQKEGDGWHLSDRLLLSEYPPLQMRQFSQTNHCSLTALTSVFSCFRRQGFSKIPDDPQELFSTLYDLARRRMIYHPLTGTFPWRLPELARLAWRRFGYPGKAHGLLVLSPRQDLEALLLAELRAHRPGIISLTHKPYSRHSVTFYGAEVWAKEDRVRVYLRINSHWTVAPRYLDVSSLGTWKGSYAAICLLHA